MNALDLFKLEGDLVLLTGGAGLLGRHYTQALTQAGATVVVADINCSAVSETETIFPLTMDVTKEASIVQVKKEIFKKFSRYPSILINNAAIDPKFESSSERPASRLENFSLEQWTLELNVGLTGAMLCAKHFGVEMAKAGQGVIINVASDLGIIAPDQRLYKKEGVPKDQQPVKPVTYSAIKHGLIGITKYIATYWADQGVRCNAFAPGGVFNNHSEEFVTKLASRIPMGRMAAIDEYNATIVYLCSKASSYLNGATLVMDGGRHIL